MDSALRRWLRYTLVLVLTSAGAGLALFVWLRPTSLSSAMAAELQDRGCVLSINAQDLALPEVSGTDVRPSSTCSAVYQALSGTNEDVLIDAMQKCRCQTLLIGRTPRTDGSPKLLLSRLSSLESFRVLRGLWLGPDAVLYRIGHDVTLSSDLRTAVLQVSMGMLRGARAPQIQSFPEPLRRPLPVELLLVLREGKQPRLWRSAKEGSLARALLTASQAARDRWAEREHILGGPLRNRLPYLTVEVSIIAEDGTLGDRSSTFLRQAIRPQNGIGFERKGAWHYLLPEFVHTTSVVSAYRRLFRDNGYDPDSFDRKDFRLYRLRTTTIATSKEGNP